MGMLVALDLEFCGDIASKGINNCRIWEVGAVVVSPHRRGQCFSATVNMPMKVNGEEIRQHAGYPRVTKAFLKAEGARPLTHVLRDFVRWLGGPAVLVGHNAYKTDKPILERAFRRCGMRPAVWWLDSLPILRDAFPRRGVWTLASFYSQGVQHRALSDAWMLAQLIWCFKLPLTMPVPIFHTPLRSLKGVGRRSEQILNRQGLSSIEMLARAYRISV